MDDAPADEVSRSLSALEVELGEVAEVGKEVLAYGIVKVDITPSNRRALPMSWMESARGSEIIFQPLGHGAARWELGRTLSDVAIMRNLAISIAEGRVRETFTRRVSSIQVTLADGTTATQTAISGFLSALGWKRRDQTVEYVPYAAS